VAPGDFPFLARVAGHDDSEVLHFQALLDALAGGRDAARELADGFALGYGRATAPLAAMAELRDLVGRLLPWVTVEVEEEDGAGVVWLRLCGPDAFKGFLRRRLAKNGR
jgi:hypothetical protein